jgi:hypothetical protein
VDIAPGLRTYFIDVMEGLFDIFYIWETLMGAHAPLKVSFILNGKKIVNFGVRLTNVVFQ